MVEDFQLAYIKQIKKIESALVALVPISFLKFNPKDKIRKCYSDQRNQRKPMLVFLEPPRT
jgi:hypothetical protein